MLANTGLTARLGGSLEKSQSLKEQFPVCPGQRGFWDGRRLVLKLVVTIYRGRWQQLRQRVMRLF